MNAWLIMMCLCGGVLVTTASLAQSRTVINGVSPAQQCYAASVTAAASRMANREAIKQCNQAIRFGRLKKRDLVATYVNRGVLKVAVNELQGAAKDYQKAIAMDSSAAEAYLNRGNLWFASERFKEAIEDYDRAIERKSAQVYVAWFNRGLAWEKLGMFEEARSSIEMALKQRKSWQRAEQKLRQLEEQMSTSKKSEEARQ